MSRTTVDSNQEEIYTTSVAGSDMYVTENSLEVPKETKKVYEGITTYIEEQGNLEIPVGDAVVTKNDELKLEDGTVIMMHPGAFNVIMKHQQEKQEQAKAMQEKESTTIVMPHPELPKTVTKRQQNKTSKAQVGKEDR